MSTEPQLTSELTEMEALLRQFSPAPSAIDRDTLMYQAGWAAALTSKTNSTHWLWPATSAALAAALLLLIVFPATSPLQQTKTELADHTQPVEENTPVATPALPTPQVVLRFHRLPLRYSDSAPLLALRDRALRNDFEDYTAANSTSESSLPTHTTNRQLLREFLPETTRQHNPHSGQQPFWTHLNFGETT